jgi:hypothetical protein
MVRWGRDVQLSLRSVDLRIGTVVWFGQVVLGSRCERNLSQWLENAIHAMATAIQAADSGARDTGAPPKWLLTAQSLAGALQPTTNRRALDLLDVILTDQVDEPRALALAAWCYAQRAVYNWSSNADQDRDEAKRFAAAATQIGADDPESLTTIATARTLVGDRNGAEVLLVGRRV